MFLFFFFRNFPFGTFIAYSRNHAKREILLAHLLLSAGIMPKGKYCWHIYCLRLLLAHLLLKIIFGTSIA